MLGKLFLRCVRIQLLRPGGYFGYEILHSEGHGSDEKGTADPLPQSRDSLPPLDVVHDWHECDRDEVKASRVVVYLALPPQHHEGVAQKILRD